MSSKKQLNERKERHDNVLEYIRKRGECTGREVAQGFGKIKINVTLATLVKKGRLKVRTSDIRGPNRKICNLYSLPEYSAPVRTKATEHYGSSVTLFALGSVWRGQLGGGMANLPKTHKN